MAGSEPERRGRDRRERVDDEVGIGETARAPSRIGHRDDLHAGRVRSGDTCGRVLDDEAAARIGAELGAARRKMSVRACRLATRGSSPSTIALKTRNQLVVARRLELEEPASRARRERLRDAARGERRGGSRAPGIARLSGKSRSSMASRSCEDSSGVIGSASVSTR